MKLHESSRLEKVNLFRQIKSKKNLPLKNSNTLLSMQEEKETRVSLFANMFLRNPWSLKCTMQDAEMIAEIDLY